MNTIKDLALNWWNKLSNQEKAKLTFYFDAGRRWECLFEAEIESIFYQEVIVKWYVGKFGKVEFDYNEKEIRNIYLKEHTKEQPLKGDVLEEELWNTPQSVDNTIQFEKWLEDKKQRYSTNKEECYQDILSSTTSAIDQYLKSPYQAQKGVLESAVKCNEMFLEFCDSQPKAIEDNVWDEVFQHYGKPFTSGRDLWDFLKQHYSLIKK
jgi:hypothetical protein